MRLDGALVEHIGFPCVYAVLRHNLQRTEQRVAVIVRKHHAVRPGIEYPVLLLERVIELV